MQYELPLTGGRSGLNLSKACPEIMGCRGCVLPKRFSLPGMHFCAQCPGLPTITGA